MASDSNLRPLIKGEALSWYSHMVVRVFNWIPFVGKKIIVYTSKMIH